MLIGVFLSVLFSCGENYTFDVFRPSNLTASFISSYEISLSWMDNSDNETGFVIQREDENGSFQTIFTTEPDVRLYSDITVFPGNTYRYRIAAEIAEDLSDWSDTAFINVTEDLTFLNFGTDETLDVMTWNLENFPKAGYSTVNYIEEVIINTEIDIIALQEIEEENYFEALVDSLQGYNGFRANSAYADINLAFVYKNELIVNDVYEIFTDDSYAFPRSPLVIELTFDGNFIVIINNHFKAFGEPSDVARRREAVQKIDEYIVENLPLQKVIILGDLNDDITEPETDNVFWEFISQSSEYFFADTIIAEGPPSLWSYPGGSWSGHLDHILITNELFDEFEYSNSDVQTILVNDFLYNGWSEYEAYISDHRPVAIKLKFDE